MSIFPKVKTTPKDKHGWCYCLPISSTHSCSSAPYRQQTSLFSSLSIPCFFYFAKVRVYVYTYFLIFPSHKSKYMAYAQHILSFFTYFQIIIKKKFKTLKRYFQGFPWEGSSKLRVFSYLYLKQSPGNHFSACFATQRLLKKKQNN